MKSETGENGIIPRKTDSIPGRGQSNINSLYHHQSVLPKDRSFTANSGTKAEVLLNGRSLTANSGTKIAVLRGMNRCGSFPFLSAPPPLSLSL